MWCKKPMKNGDVDVDDISKLIETNYRYLIEYLHKVIRPLVLILPIMCGYVKIFIDKNNKLIPFCINDDKLLEKHKTI